MSTAQKSSKSKRRPRHRATVINGSVIRIGRNSEDSSDEEESSDEDGEEEAAAAADQPEEEAVEPPKSPTPPPPEVREIAQWHPSPTSENLRIFCGRAQSSLMILWKADAVRNQLADLYCTLGAFLTPAVIASSEADRSLEKS